MRTEGEARRGGGEEEAALLGDGRGANIEKGHMVCAMGKAIDLLCARSGKQVHVFLRSAAARRNPSFSSFSEPEFQGSGLDGKKYIVSRAKEELGK